jgi:hypothetical protein
VPQQEERPKARWWRASGAVVLYLVGSFLVLYPALSTPVVSDDFVNPFEQTALGGSGLSDAIHYGWTGSTGGVSFRVFGTVIGSIFNWFWLTTSATFDVSMSTIYAAVKFIVLVACAASVAGFWAVASREYGRGIRSWDALVLTSLALFGTLQIHQLWSNDPVASYPLSGYGATALGFLVLTAAVVLNRRRNWPTAVIGGVVATFAVLYYEVNIGAVIGAAILLVAGVVSSLGQRREAVLHTCRAALFVGMPATLILVGRAVTGARQSDYAGTDISFSHAGRTVLLGLANIVPGTSWGLSSKQLGGHISLVYFVLGLMLFLCWVTRWWAQEYRPTSAVVGRSSLNSLGIAAAIAGPMVYGFFAIILQAVTVKIQNETADLGHVYTYYAMGSSVVALGLAVTARSLFFRQGLVRVRFVAAAVAISFVLVQQTINWRLSESLNSYYAVNHHLLDAFAKDVPEAKRCDAFTAWTVIPWPDYYRIDMRDGLNDAYQYYFNEPFCTEPGF